VRKLGRGIECVKKMMMRRGTSKERMTKERMTKERMGFGKERRTTAMKRVI
jgi:hypothetical protein